MSDPAATLLVRTRAQAHPTCGYCQPQVSPALALVFNDGGSGGVQATVACPADAQGYPGLVHGGLAAGWLDAAMTNALFAKGVAALTGRLSVRYHQPLRLAESAIVTAQVSEQRGPWWIVRGKISQSGQLAVSAEAWFKDRAADQRQSTAG